MQEDLDSTLTNHLKNLMKEPNIDREEERKEILANIPSLVTQEQNELLLWPIEMVELEEVVKKLKNNKASSPDDFTTNFFHACWHTIKDEVLSIVEDSRKTGKIMKYFNSTFFTLIPK